MSAALVLAFALAAPAAEGDIRWTVPAGCPDRQALLDGIARRRGKPLEPGQARLHARARTQGPQRWRLDLELEVAGRRDTRVLHAKTCSALVDGVALVVSLAIDGDPGTAPAPAPAAPDDPTLAEPGLVPAPPDLVPAPPGAAGPSPGPGTLPAPPEPVPAPPAAAQAPLEPPASPPTPPESEPTLPEPALVTPETAPEPLATDPRNPPRRRLGGFVRLHGLGELGALPGPSGGLGLAGGLLWRWFRLELHANYLAPRLLDRPELRARVSLFSFAAVGCARLGRGRLEVPLCLGFEAGGLPAVADSGRTVFGRWLALGGGLGAAVRVHPRVALWAFLQGLAAVQRGTLAVTEPGRPDRLRVLYDPGVGSARLALGVEVRFGDPR